MNRGVIPFLLGMMLGRIGIPVLIHTVYIAAIGGAYALGFYGK